VRAIGQELVKQGNDWERHQAGQVIRPVDVASIVRARQIRRVVGAYQVQPDFYQYLRSIAHNFLFLTV